MQHAIEEIGDRLTNDDVIPTQVRVIGIESTIVDCTESTQDSAPGKSDGRGRRTRHRHAARWILGAGREYYAHYSPRASVLLLKRWNSQSRPPSGWTHRPIRGTNAAGIGATQ